MRRASTRDHQGRQSGHLWTRWRKARSLPTTAGSNRRLQQRLSWHTHQSPTACGFRPLQRRICRLSEIKSAGALIFMIKPFRNSQESLPKSQNLPSKGAIRTLARRLPLTDTTVAAVLRIIRRGTSLVQHSIVGASGRSASGRRQATGSGLRRQEQYCRERRHTPRFRSRIGRSLTGCQGRSGPK